MHCTLIFQVIVPPFSVFGTLFEISLTDLCSRSVSHTFSGRAPGLLVVAVASGDGLKEEPSGEGTHKVERML